MTAMTPATEFNLRRKSHWADHVQMFRGRPLPSWLELSLTELCNRSAGSPKACVFCPRIDGEFYPNHPLHMDIVLVRRIAANLLDLQYEGGVVLCGYGEPLLHPEILEVCRTLAPFRLEIVTNGDRLTATRVRDLLEAGCDCLVVSMYDGPEQVEQLRSIMEEAGATEDQYVLRDRWHGPEADYGLRLTNRGGAVMVGQQAPVDARALCYYPSYQMMVDWNGDVLLCPQDWSKRLRFGSLRSQRIEDVWYSAILHRRRRDLLSGREGRKPCEDCNANGCLHGAAHARAWLVDRGTTARSQSPTTRTDATL